MALPNGPMEIVFSFDTTGSMSSCLDEVRGRVSDMVQRLQGDIPGIRISIFAHGDYCDSHTYVTKYEDFTDDVTRLCNFAQNVERTGGGDADECYELVLHEVRTKLSWTPGSQRALVMIGDCNPHEPNYAANKLKLNWRDEADSLAGIGVRIYSVQCGSHSTADRFYADIAKRTDGQHLKLDDFKNIFDFLMTVCYKEKGADFFDTYEKEVRARCGPIHKDLHNLFGNLRDTAPTGTGSLVAGTSTSATSTPALKATSVKTLIAKKVGKPPMVKKTSTAAFKRARVPKNRNRFTDKYLPRLRRENVPENNFMMKNLSWSKWQLAISPVSTDSTMRKRPGAGCCGFRTRQLFDGKTNIPALYEVAVQTKYRTRKCVVYSKMCRRGFASGLKWEKNLLGKSDIRKQVDEVVAKNCKIFVRRVILKSEKANTTARESLKRYDYAWKGIRSERKTHRQVTQCNVDISTAMEI